MYVDTGTGSDEIDKGGGTTTNAFDTVQYAVSQIPSLYSGDVTIIITAESYSETVTIGGKNPTGDYTITLQGTLSAHDTNTQQSSVQGSGATYGSITDTGEFTGHAGDLLYSSNNDEYRVIDETTDDTATIVEYWGAAPSGDYTIYQWGTEITSLVINAGQTGVIVNDIYFSSGIDLHANSSSVLTRVKATASSTSVLFMEFAPATTLYDCYLYSSANLYVLYGNAHADCLLYRVKVWNSNNNGKVAYANRGSYIGIYEACVFDGYVDGVNKALYGFGVFGGSVCTMGNLYNKVQWCDTGIWATTGGQIMYVANNQYSDCSTTETEDTSTSGHIS